jgi:hypothetical protein
MGQQHTSFAARVGVDIFIFVRAKSRFLSVICIPSQSTKNVCYLSINVLVDQEACLLPSPSLFGCELLLRRRW